MAISYLAMGLAKKRGGYAEVLPFDFPSEEEEKSWQESGAKIPVIFLSEMMVYMRNDDLPFESNGFLVAQSQSRNKHQPYWKTCTQESVCVIVRRSSIDSTSLNYINLFSENRNVFVLFLVGIEDIKQQVYDIVNVMKYNKLRGQMNIQGSKFHNVHVMLGAPGTAKTTVAKYMGQLMFNEKLLPDNRFICINGAELKGMYVGHSAPKTKALFTKYDVIIIDEAYSIVESNGETDSFGNEAIAQLIIELENHSTDKLVIFAGYGGEVKEMAIIFERIAKNSNYDLQPGTDKVVESFFEERVGRSNFGNGREARVLLETAVIYAAKRVMAEEKENVTPQEMRLLTIEDIQQAIVRMRESFGTKRTKNNPIGFAC